MSMSIDALQSLTLKGTFLCLREGVKAMVSGSRVINISSAATVHPSSYNNGC
jgi:NAD(P)-dependent dehydrogenase (short-subunit alcohol dehydrogenase family)